MDYTADSFIKKLIKAVILVSILMMVGSIAFFRSFYAIGFVLGIGISLGLNIIKILWLRHSANRAVNMTPGAGGAFIAIQYLLRFGLTGLVLAATHFLPVVDMFGAILGILAMPFANHAISFFNRGSTNNSADNLESGQEEEESMS